MNLLFFLPGTVELELISADIPGTLAAFTKENITLFDSQKTDPYTIRFKIARKDYRILRNIALRKGGKLTLQRRKGIYWVFRKALRRPVLLVGCAFLLALTVLLPRYVLFVTVTGNAKVPDRQILNTAADLGLAPGRVRRELRSEDIKNRVLSAIPELQWAGVNTHGCLAIISVREKAEQETTLPPNGISSIIAATDGEICDLTITAGTPMCKLGDRVTGGQVLVSGFTDCGICTRGVRAEGEIYANTVREFEAVTPVIYPLRRSITATDKKISLILGKKQINFFKGSGISDSGCVKMYHEKTLTLPGGFELPVSLVWEDCIYYNYAEDTISTTSAASLLHDFLDGYLKGQIVAGNINSSEHTTVNTPNIFRMHKIYQCREMIGVTRIEETLNDYGENNRENN